MSDESYFVGDLSVATLVKAFIPEGVALPESQLVIFGTRDLFDDSDLVATQAPRKKSKTTTFLSDFRDLAVDDYVVHVEHGIGQYLGLKEITQDEATAEFMVLEYAESAKLYVPLTRLDLIQKYRSAEGARPALAHLGTQQWAEDQSARKESHEGYGRGTGQALRRARAWRKATAIRPTRNGKKNLKTPSSTTRLTTRPRRSKT